jgi:hypothetical protein
VDLRSTAPTTVGDPTERPRRAARDDAGNMVNVPRWQSRRPATSTSIALVALVAAGCNAIFGVGDLEYRNDGASGGADSTVTTSGAGGTASSGGGATGGTTSTTSSTSGSGGNGGSAASGKCGVVAALADDFEDPALDAEWESIDGPANVPTEKNGTLELALPTNDTALEMGYHSRHRYDLRDSAASVEVVQVAAGSSSTRLEVWGDVDHDLSIRQADGTLYATMEIAGFEDSVTTAYDATDHRHWRIREQGGTLFWEASTDGVSWSALRQEPLSPAFDAKWVEQRLEAETGGTTATSTAVFDNFNGGSPSAPLCKAESLERNFDGGSFPGPAFRLTAIDCSAMLAGGRLELLFDVGADSGDRCIAYSEALYDLSDSEAVVELVAASSSTGVYSWLGIDDPAQADTTPGLSFEVFNGQLRATSWGVATNVLASTNYNATMHRWLRLKGDGGDIKCETSPDGSAWTTLFEGASPLDLSRVQLNLGIWTAAAAGGELARFDNLNLDP